MSCLVEFLKKFDVNTFFTSRNLKFTNIIGLKLKRCLSRVNSQRSVTMNYPLILQTRNQINLFAPFCVMKPNPFFCESAIYIITYFINFSYNILMQTNFHFKCNKNLLSGVNHHFNNEYKKASKYYLCFSLCFVKS